MLATATTTAYRSRWGDDPVIQPRARPRRTLHGPAIDLTPDAMAYISDMVRHREAVAKARHAKDAHGYQEQDRVWTSWAGVAAEVGVAWFYGLAWPRFMGLPPDGFPDVGQRSQVRSIRDPRKNLFVRDLDLIRYRGHRWFLGLVLAPDHESDVFRVVLCGWATPDDIPRFSRREGAAQNHGRPAAWIFPRDRLTPVDALQPLDV
jgi:hypothetical protein